MANLNLVADVVKIELAKVNNDGEYEDAGSFDSIEDARTSLTEDGDGDYVASRGDTRWEWGFRVFNGKVIDIAPEMM